MVNAQIQQELSLYLSQLPVDRQQEVVDFARSLMTPAITGTPGKNLLSFAGGIEAVDLHQMEEAIDL